MAKSIVLDIIGRDRASAVFDRVAASASASASKMDMVNRRITAAGAALTRSVTVPVVAAAAASAKFATDFQAAMTRVHTQAGGSARDVQILSKQVLELSKSTQQGPVQLADALYHLKSVGMGNVDAMKALAVTTKLAAVGHADLEAATNALAGAWRTGISGAKNFGQAAATVNAIIGAGNMRMDDFTAAIGTGILPAAKTFGLSLKQVGGALALMTDEGVPAVDAATRLRMTFALIGAPSKVATGWLSQIHIKALDLANAMRHPNTGLIDAVQMLKDHLEKFGGSAAKQSMILARAFGGGRSSATIMSLINNLDVLRKKQEQVNNTVGKFGAAVAAQQQTAQAKFANLVSNLQRVAVEVGNQVLPYVIQLTQKIGDAVTWFGNLSRSTQGSVVKFALLAAALGPALSILGRLTRALTLLVRGWYLLVYGADAAVMATARLVAGMRLAEISIEGMSTRSYLAGMRLRQTFTAMGTTGAASLKMLGAAAAGGAVGVGLGQLSKNADTTTKVLDTLGSAAAGAALGLAVGGPLGAAVGGLGGLVGSLVVNFLHTGSAAQSGAKQAAAAMKQQQADAQDLLSVLQSVNGAYSAQYRQSIVSKLGKSGGLDVLSRLGMNSPNTISTILGQNGPRALANLYASIENEAAAGRIDYKSMNLLVGAIQHLSPAAAAAEKQFEEQAQAMHGGVLAANQLNARYNNLRAIFRLTGTTLDDVSAAGLHNRAALTQIAQASNTAAVRAIEHGKAIGQTTMAYEGQQNQLRFNLEALGFQSKAVEDLIGKYKLTPTQIVTKLVADARAGIGTSREYQNIIDAIRQHKVPGLNANAGQGKSIIADLQRRIDLLRGKTVDINVNTNYRQNGVPSPTGGRAFFAAGGTVAGGIPGRDSVPIMAMPGEEIIPTRQANKYRALLKAIAAGAKGFASGGTVGGTSLMSIIERAGFRGRAAATMYGIVMAESGGNPHALNNNPRTGDLSYGLAQINMIGGLGPSRRRAYHLSSDSALYDPLTNLRVAYSLSGHGRNFSPWTTYTSGAFRHYATGAPSVTLSGSSGSSSGAAAHRAAAAAAVQARNQRISTTVGGASTAISAVNGVAGSPRFDPNNFSEAAFRWQVRAANASIQVAKAAGASAATLKKLTDRLREYTKQGELTYLQQQKARLLAPINARLASARQASAQLGSSVSSAVLGGFDITSMGQVYNDQPATASSIKDAAWAVFKNAQKFVAVLKTLRKEGLGAGLVAQLAQAGPAALPQAEALAKGTPAQLKSITSAYAGLHTLAGQAAGVATDYAYGGQIKNFEQQQKSLAEAIGREVAKVMAKHPTQVTISGLADIDAAIKALERRLSARV